MKPTSIAAILIAVSLFWFSPSWAAPDCGQSTVLGQATKVYDNKEECTKDKNNLSDNAKDDLIKQCTEYCAFLSKECTMQPVLTRKNVTAKDADCTKLQDDKKIHARATAGPLECICKPKG